MALAARRFEQNESDRKFLDQLSRMDAKYIYCRKWGHHAVPDGSVDEDYAPREIAIGLECDSCGLQWDEIIDNTDGRHLARVLVGGYPEGYLFRGTGRLTPEERGQIALLATQDLREQAKAAAKRKPGSKDKHPASGPGATVIPFNDGSKKPKK